MLRHRVEYNSSLRPQERLIAAFISRLNMNLGTFRIRLCRTITLSLNKYQCLEMDGQLNLPRKLDFRLFLCLERKKKVFFKQVMQVITCVLHNLIYEDTMVTYYGLNSLSQEFQLHIVKKKKKEERKKKQVMWTCRET